MVSPHHMCQVVQMQNLLWWPGPQVSSLSPMWGYHFLIETHRVCEIWDLTLKLGSRTTQKILSVLDPVVKVSNIVWSVHLKAECTYRCWTDWFLVALQQLMGSAVGCAVLPEAQYCRAGGTISHYAALHLLNAGLCSIEQTISL